MKKLIVLLIIVILASGCASKKNFSLSFEGEIMNNDFIEIYKIDDKNSLYSQYTKNYYIGEDGQKIDLAIALEDKVITVDDIIDKMEFHLAANDGGTIRYSSKKLFNNFSNVDFDLDKCETLNVIPDKENGAITRYFYDVYIGEKDFECSCSLKSDIELSFEGEKLEEDFVEIYKIDDNNSIYSQYTEVYYISIDKDKTELSTALAEGLVDLDYIIYKMEEYDSYNDGNAKRYRYEKSFVGYSNIDFDLDICNVKNYDVLNNEYVGDLYLGEKDFKYQCVD